MKCGCVGWYNVKCGCVGWYNVKCGCVGWYNVKCGCVGWYNEVFYGMLILIFFLVLACCWDISACPIPHHATHCM